MELRGKVFFLLVLTLVALSISGCGETIRGVYKDTTRIYRGTKTIFVSGN